MRETDRPVQIQTLQLKGKTWEELVNQIPENSFVSGQLKATETFSSGREIPSAITITSRALKFQFAQKADISRLQPIPQNLSERKKNLSEEILRICEKLEIAKMAYPPIHYLELSRMEQQLRKKRNTETRTRAIHGTLFIRIFSNQPSAFSPPNPPKGKNHWITGVVLARGGLLHAMTTLQHTISRQLTADILLLKTILEIPRSAAA